MFGLGLVLQNQANFSRNYVSDELTAHGITFSPVEALLPSQKYVECLIANAGLDLALVDGGKTYAQDHYNGSAIHCFVIAGVLLAAGIVLLVVPKKKKADLQPA